MHLVSAFSADVGLVLGRTATAAKFNEIAAIAELLATLALKGCVVTLDAMSTQTGIAKAIRERGADYVLGVKDNHPKLLESFLLGAVGAVGVGGALAPSSTSEHREDAHGRREVRRCWAFAELTGLYKAEQWPALRSFAIIQRERTVGTKTTCERRDYIGSLPAEAARIARAVRGHWEVENPVHWRLEIQFNQDPSSVCTGFAANDRDHRAPHRDEPAALERLTHRQHQDQAHAGRDVRSFARRVARTSDTQVRSPWTNPRWS